jgi:HEAT repeat protein
MKYTLVLGLLLSVAGCQQQPTFEGRPLGHWVEQLKSRDYMTRMRAAHALMYLGPGAKKAIPDLITLLDDPEHLVRWSAATTLGGFGPDSRDAVPLLERLAEKDPNHAVREAAGQALKQIRPGGG